MHEGRRGTPWPRLVGVAAVAALSTVACARTTSTTADVDQGTTASMQDTATQGTQSAGTQSAGTQAAGTSTTGTQGAAGTTRTESAGALGSPMRVTKDSPDAGAAGAGNMGYMSSSGGAMALSASDAAMLRAMTDANVVAHLAMGDSAEIVSGQTAERNAQSTALRDFARTLVTDHSRSYEQGSSLAAQRGIAPAPAPDDTMAMHMAMMMNQLSGAGGSFDRDFLQMQIMHHQHMLSELNLLRSTVRDPALQQHIASVIPVVQMHLSRAQQLGGQMGLPSGGGMQGMQMQGGQGTTGATGTPRPPRH
ncbi:MAG: DUF4142 domain-containing protein [Gemmatimonadaceae bacterium]